jgi:regulator of replication initiation timing
MEQSTDRIKVFITGIVIGVLTSLLIVNAALSLGKVRHLTDERDALTQTTQSQSVEIEALKAEADDAHVANTLLATKLKKVLEERTALSNENEALKAVVGVTGAEVPDEKDDGTEETKEEKPSFLKKLKFWK